MIVELTIRNEHRAILYRAATSEPIVIPRIGEHYAYVFDDDGQDGTECYVVKTIFHSYTKNVHIITVGVIRDMRF